MVACRRRSASSSAPTLAPRIVRRVRPAYVMGAGLALAAVGLGDPDPGRRLERPRGRRRSARSSSRSASRRSSALTTELIVGSAPPERAGAASGISETGAELGGALGISILGSIGVAIYRGDVADALPAGVPAEAADVARDTLGGAVARRRAAARPARRRRCSTSPATRSSTGCRSPPTISAVVAVGVAILAVVMLRNVGRAPSARPTTAPRSSGGRPPSARARHDRLRDPRRPAPRCRRPDAPSPALRRRTTMPVVHRPPRRPSRSRSSATTDPRPRDRARRRRLRRGPDRRPRRRRPPAGGHRPGRRRDRRRDASSRLARETGLELAVRSGGHSGAGHSVDRRRHRPRPRAT